MSYKPSFSGSIASTTNNSTTPLAAGATFTGTGERINYQGVTVSCKTDQVGKLYFDFSNDNTNWDTFPTNGFDLAAGIHEYQRARKDYRYFRARVENTSANPQTYLRLYTYYGEADLPSAPLNQSIGTDSSAIITRSVVVGSDQTGQYRNVPVNAEGALDVNIAGPLTAFGQIIAERNRPVVQVTAVYGLGSKMRTQFSGTGATAGATANEFFATSGTSAAGVSTVFTRAAAVYKAGQGLSFPFTARFDTPRASTVQWAGPQNGTDGITVGYLGTTFGLFYRHGGQHEIRTLTFTSGASSSANCTITLNSVAYTVALTSGGGVTGAAREAAASLNSQASALWVCTAVNDKVIIRATSARVAGGTYSFSADTTGSAASFSTQSTGVALTEDFTALADWNGADCSWLDPSKGNVYRVDVQYLGYGDIDLYIEFADPKRYELAHRLHLANELTTTNVTNPSYRIGWTSSNRGDTTGVTVRGASAAAFTQGDLIIQDESRSYSVNKASVSTEVAVLTVKALDVLDGKVSLSDILLQSLSVSTDSTKGAIFKVYKNATLAGSPVYNFIEEGVSIAVVDVAGTTVSGGRLLNTITIGAAQSRNVDLTNYDIKLFPSDTLTVTAQITSGAASSMVVALTWKEDI